MELKLTVPEGENLVSCDKDTSHVYALISQLVANKADLPVIITSIAFFYWLMGVDVEHSNPNFSKWLEELDLTSKFSKDSDIYKFEQYVIKALFDVTDYGVSTKEFLRVRDSIDPLLKLPYTEVLIQDLEHSDLITKILAELVVYLMRCQDLSELEIPQQRLTDQEQQIAWEINIPPNAGPVKFKINTRGQQL